MPTCINTGHTMSADAAEHMERAHRERRLALILQIEGDGSPAIAERISQHHRRAVEFETKAKAIRGY